MTDITEIIPDDMPAWMKEAMDEGQLFNKTIAKVKEMDYQLEDMTELLKEIANGTHKYCEMRVCADYLSDCGIEFEEKS